VPLYEYQCEKCGESFEVMQKFADEPLTTHPACGGPVHRLISAPALQFKGSGWYITDYAKGSNAPGTNGSSKSGDSSKSKESGTEASSKSADSSSSEKKSSTVDSK
jgi:putative FmdB family regulatory protein